MSKTFTLNLLWHLLMISMAGFVLVFVTLELTGFARPLSFHIGWAVAATVFGAVGTLPFFICYRAATGKWFAEYFWLLWTVWMMLIFLGLPGTYIGQKMQEVNDHPLLQELKEREKKFNIPAAENPDKSAEPVELDFDGFRV